MDKRGNSVLENIKANYEKLFSAEKKAAAYILANPEQAIMMNISSYWPEFWSSTLRFREPT